MKATFSDDDLLILLANYCDWSPKWHRSFARDCYRSNQQQTILLSKYYTIHLTATTFTNITANMTTNWISATPTMNKTIDLITTANMTLDLIITTTRAHPHAWTWIWSQPLPKLWTWLQIRPWIWSQLLPRTTIKTTIYTKKNDKGQL